MHPEFGMGIEFASGTEEQREQVGNFIGFLTSQPGTVPQLLITPKTLAVGNNSDYARSKEASEPEDLLLDLLNRADSLSQEDFCGNSASSAIRKKSHPPSALPTF
jgi:hypothetical protein